MLARATKSGRLGDGDKNEKDSSGELNLNSQIGVD
jgi:hypothetical protein